MERSGLRLRRSCRARGGCWWLAWLCCCCIPSGKTRVRWDCQKIGLGPRIFPSGQLFTQRGNSFGGHWTSGVSPFLADESQNVGDLLIAESCVPCLHLGGAELHTL